MPDPVTPDHLYHAEAVALKGTLQMPLRQTIDPQATAILLPKGGYLSQKTGEFRLESVVAFKSAHTQVSGMPGTKQGHGHATLTTAVVEGLNILEVLTCDRIVSQVATEHPIDGHTPAITFLGTRFENLRIAGHEVNVTLDINALGPKPPNDLHHIHEPGFLAKVAAYCQALRNYSGLPQAARQRYTGIPTVNGPHESVDYSLVTSITGKFPGTAFGHVIDVPEFGVIHLATVKISLEDDKNAPEAPPKTTVELKMLEVKMGCIGDGSVDVGSAKTNGGKTG